MNDNKQDGTGETTDDFRSRIMSNMTGGFSTLGVSLASRLGLFEVMSRFSEPATSQEIADAAGFRERYVRELLGVLCASNIVSLDVTGKKYYIPEHRRFVLTDPSEAAVFTWALPIMSVVDRDLVECFKPTGPRGIPYSKYPGFLAWRERHQTAIREWCNLSKTLSLVPGLLQELESGIEMVDLGTGRGGMPLTTAKQFPNSKFWGLDLDEDAMNRARSDAEKQNLQNTSFRVQDICSMPADWANKFDFVCMFDVAHDVPYTTKMLKEVLRVLKPGKFFLMVDIDMRTDLKDNLDNPLAATWYGISLYHCMAVSLNTEGGEGWGTAWGREAAVGLLKKTGFVDVQIPDNTGLSVISKKPEQ